jgi:hypothetical protein
MNYNLLDDSHIEVIAGDIAAGHWSFTGEALSRDDQAEIQLKHNTKTLEVRLKRQVDRLDTLSDLPVAGLASVACALAFGPLGGLAVAGAGIVAGKDDFYCIGCHLKDGRKFIAYMRAALFERWYKSCPEARKIDKKK